MRVPAWIKPGVWGAIFGAVGTMIVGFSWLGWTLGHTTTRLVAEGRESGIVAALTPFCVANYMKQPDAGKQLALLKGILRHTPSARSLRRLDLPPCPATKSQRQGSGRPARSR